MNQRRLFIASCLSLVVTAMIFVIRGDIAPEIEPAFGLSHEDYAFVSTMAFFGFAASILVASPMLDALGMRNLLYLRSRFISAVFWPSSSHRMTRCFTCPCSSQASATVWSRR